MSFEGLRCWLRQGHVLWGLAALPPASQQWEGSQGLGCIFCCGRFEGKCALGHSPEWRWGFPPMTWWAFFSIYSCCSLQNGTISQDRLEKPSLKPLSPPKPQTGQLPQAVSDRLHFQWDPSLPDTHVLLPLTSLQTWRVLQTKFPFLLPSHLSSQMETNAKHEACGLHFHRDENTQRD